MISEDLALFLTKETLEYALLIISPPVAASLLCGLIFSILQTLTQIQDSSLSFIPKALAVLLSLFFCGSWMLHQLDSFTRQMFSRIAGILS